VGIPDPGHSGWQFKFCLRVTALALPDSEAESSSAVKLDGLDSEELELEVGPRPPEPCQACDALAPVEP
jgi:hypothetical protein